MTVLDAVLQGATLVAISLVAVLSLRYLGLVPATKPPKRTWLFEDETGDRRNPFDDRDESRRPLHVRCPRCGRRNGAAYSFCAACTTRLATQEPHPRQGVASTQGPRR